MLRYLWTLIFVSYVFFLSILSFYCVRGIVDKFILHHAYKGQYLQNTESYV